MAAPLGHLAAHATGRPALAALGETERIALEAGTPRRVQGGGGPSTSRPSYLPRQTIPSLSVAAASLPASAAQGRVERAPGQALANAACAAGLISEAEVEALHAAEAAREEVIQVDVFDAIGSQRLRR